MHWKYFRKLRRFARVSMVICMILAVLVNGSLIKALYSSEEWWLAKLFKHNKVTTSHTLGVTSRAALVIKNKMEVIPKCSYYNSSAKNHSHNISEDFRNSHFMAVDMNGRLGNQMFKFASLLGLAAQHGYTPFLAQKSLLLSAFKEQKYFHLVGMSNSVMFHEIRAGVYDCRTKSLLHSNNFTLIGYFQSWKYFDHIRPQIRKEFQFTDDLRRRARDEINKLKPGNKTLIGVHVRRGDMNSARELRRGYNVADPNYFEKALNYFRYKYYNVFFVVVSDSIHWARNNIAGDDLGFIKTGIAYLDMTILTECSHTIITSGTFGWWGAYLAGGNTIYFKDYPRKDTWLDQQYIREDYYPPNWIGM